jgi:membrane carboxypeptidase/penicillin-binding protein
MRKFLNFLIKFVVVLLLVATTALVAIVGWFVWHYEYGIGLPDRQKLLAVSAADRICSSDGERNFVPLAAVPPVVRDAFLAYEEPEFFERPPINPFVEVAGAAFFRRAPRNASISNTVMRCLMSLSTECCKKQIDWHVGGGVLLGRIEKTLSKDTIFEIFLNEIYFGRNAYGAAAAARAYFGKSLSDLTVEEAAYIAALPRAPNRMSRNERGIELRNFVIDRMRAAGLISPAQAESAKRQPLVLREVSAPI